MKVDHLDVVERMHRMQPPIGTVPTDSPGTPTYQAALMSCFEFEQRVLAELRRRFPFEGWGYLKKGGDNTIPYSGETVKVGRICGPDSQLYKILTDIPTANIPIWNDDGVLTADFPGTKPDKWWMPFEGAVPIPNPNPNPDPDPIPAPVPPPVDMAPVISLLQAVLVQVNIQANLISSQSVRMEALYKDLTARTNELKAIAQQPQHYEGSLRYTGRITLDKVIPQ